MKIYLAGGISGNLSKEWSMAAIHLASALSRSELTDYLLNNLVGEHLVKNGKDMRIYLAGEHRKKNICEDIYKKTFDIRKVNILESFYYLRKNKKFLPLLPYFGSFLLDSGAFTFMAGSHKGSVDWDEYVEEYARFINKNNIELFFELDIDSIVGIKEVERLRFKLEQLTKKKPIPVWHISRKKDYFLKMCDNYPYVALGGIVTQEAPRQKYEKAFPWFISTAHRKGCKIHGLGYTTVANLSKYHFDSVDSTAWLYGNRGGYVYKFQPKDGSMKQIDPPANYRIKSKETAINNFLEWVKLGIYAEKYW